MIDDLGEMTCFQVFLLFVQELASYEGKLSQMKAVWDVFVSTS